MIIRGSVPVVLQQVVRAGMPQPGGDQPGDAALAARAVDVDADRNLRQPAAMVASSATPPPISRPVVAARAANGTS